jgi:oligopeptide/dipeptide ABC transporter ATP-binding protein
MFMEEEPLLEVRDLKVGFETEGGTALAVDGVSFRLFRGEVLGLVGESGSGKTVTCLSLTRLLPEPSARILAGSIRYRGTNLLALPRNELRRCRGNEIGMIFQEPLSSLNPVFPVRMQLCEVLARHRGIEGREAVERAVAMLRGLGIRDAARKIESYPHALSGGMCQRVMIAMALLSEPKLLVADEPTTALDVTIQAQILDLLCEVLARRPEMSMILITHNLAVVSRICHRVSVMYAGMIQESAPNREFFEHPLHPYSRGLLECLPEFARRNEALPFIPGQVADPLDPPRGCRFRPRCPHAMEVCLNDPGFYEPRPGHFVRCFLFDPKVPPERRFGKAVS